MSHTIRIRIPKQGHTVRNADDDEHDNVQPSSSVKRKQPSHKRRLVTSDDEDDDVPTSELTAPSDAHGFSSPPSSSPHVAPPRLKRARTATITNATTDIHATATTDEDHGAYHDTMNMSPLTEPPADAMDLDIDILGNTDEPVAHPPLDPAAPAPAWASPEDTRFLAGDDYDDADAHTAGGNQGRRPPKLKQVKERTTTHNSTSNGGEGRKKRAMVYSSSDEHSDADLDVVVDDDEMLDPDPDIDIDEYEYDSGATMKKRGSGAKGRSGATATKGSKGKGKGAWGKDKSSSKKEKREEREILAKDKRNFAAPQAARAISAGSLSAGGDAPRDGNSAGAEALFEDAAAGGAGADGDVVAEGPARPEGGAAAASTPTSAQPKKKLPTIRKTKAANASGSSAASTPSRPGNAAPGAGTGAGAGAGAAVAPGDTDELAKLTAPSAAARKPAAYAGISDVDLSDKNIYAELFKGGGGKSSSAGLSRQEKERQRRAELDRMRDEARAKRLAEATQPFDLQEQADKIARYEERFRREQSFVLYPNFLAAKFRAEWETARGRRREQPESRDDRAA